MPADKRKVIFPVVILVDEKSLANSSPSVHYHKFRAIGFHHPFEFLTLPLSAYKFIHHVFTLVYYVSKVNYFIALKRKNVAIIYPNRTQQ